MAVLMLPWVQLQTKADSTPTALDTDYTVVGDLMSGNGYGKDWDPTNTKGLMKEYTGGLYELTLHLKAGTYNYKIAEDGAWTTSYGDNGNNIALTVPKDEDVTFRFDYTKKTVTDSINNTDQFKTSASLAGDFNNWSQTDTTYTLTYVGGGFYTGTFSMKAGTYGYKTVYGYEWSNGEVSDNVSLKLDSDEQVTFLANPILGICEDSISDPEIAKQPSLIGTIRGDTSANSTNWTETTKGWELSYLGSNGLYVYSGIFAAGTYSYKVCDNYSWTDGGLPSSGNNSITVPADNTYVIFVCDEKNGTLYDSITNPDAVASALGISSATVKGTVINDNGTVTFNYKNANAKSVYLQGGVTASPKLMSEDKYGNWSITLRLGDAAKDYDYSFDVDGTTTLDPTNTKSNSDKTASVLSFPEYKGREVILAGTFQDAADGTWNAAGKSTLMTYQGNGVYTLTKKISAGSYEYKIAIDGAWTENYGADGAASGSNISMTVGADQNVTFTYNDDSHRVVDSIDYQPADVTLTGSEISGTAAMTDTSLTGVYSYSLLLKAGTYNDFVIHYNGKNVPVTFTLDSDRVVTISYDPASDTAFTDASSKSINTNALYFDSQNSAYKSPFGAVTENTAVKFSIRTAADDVTQAKLVIIDKSNTAKSTVVALSKASTDGTYDMWSGTFTPTEKGLYKYYFVLSNGSQVKAYGDDDGMLGTGEANDLGSVMDYDLNVSETGYTTPDWLKNAVVYQIFPDRFFDGDTSNDTAKLVSRGSTYYQFHDSWYSEPYAPSLSNDSDTTYCNDIYGGDLKGIDDKLDYLQALGVTTIYLNPIFDSVSNHRYDTSDYSEIDPFLGDLDDYVTLAQDLNKRGMHLILDGVYNHVSDDSVYFDRYGKYVKAGQPLGAYQYWKSVYDKMNADKSLTQAQAETEVQAAYEAKGITDFHYKDWFIVRNETVAAVSGDSAHYDYDGWDGYDSMPEIQALDGSEDNVTTWKDEILAGSSSTTTTWLNDTGSETGVRLDAAEQLSDQTWRTFRSSVKTVSSDDAIIGEIWTDASKYLLGDEFDSVMNYLYRGALTNFVDGAQTSSYVSSEFEAIRERYPQQAFEDMLNIVDSHDTARIRTTLEGDTASVATKGLNSDGSVATDSTIALMKLVAMMQMTYPGAPTIYYGDELGMVGGADPDSRRAMAWGEGSKDLVDTYALYANIRDTYSVLRTGSISMLSSGSDDVLAYTRADTSNSALVLINRGKAVSDLSVDVSGKIADGTKLYDASNGTAYTVSGGKVTVNVSDVSGLVLVSSYQKITLNETALKAAYDSSYKVADRTGYSSDEATSDTQTAVDNAITSGASVITTADKMAADEARAALESGLSISLSSNNTYLTFENKLLASYLNEQNIDSITYSADTPKTSIEEAIQKLVKAGKADLLAAYTLSTNLPEADCTDGTTLTLPVSASYNGKTVYLYYYDTSTGSAEKVTSAVVKDGKATFAITHFSTYFVTDAVLQTSGTTTTTTTTTTTSAGTSASSQTSASSKAANPDTGGLPEGTPVVPFIVFLGATPLCLLMLKKRKRS